MSLGTTYCLQKSWHHSLLTGALIQHNNRCFLLTSFILHKALVIKCLSGMCTHRLEYFLTLSLASLTVFAIQSSCPCYCDCFPWYTCGRPERTFVWIQVSVTSTDWLVVVRTERWAPVSRIFRTPSTADNNNCFVHMQLSASYIRWHMSGHHYHKLVAIISDNVSSIFVRMQM